MTAPHLISALHDLDEAQAAAAAATAPEPDAPARRQPGQLVEVFVEGEPPYTVRITNRDRIAYEKAAARHKEWPESGRSFAMTFLCWSAARRDGRTALTFDQWQAALEDWDVVQVTGTDPTQ